MSVRDHSFLFESLDSKQPSTTRKVHLRRLYDILQLCFQRNDFQRAKRVWAILARCKEIDWLALWTTGLHILAEDDAHENKTQRTVEYLRAMMLQYPDDREAILKELIFRLLLAGKCREALDELDLYLPSFPYQDNPVFHIYAGLISLYLAQPTLASAKLLNPILVRDAQTHFEHAKALDQENVVAQAFLDKILAMQNDQGNSYEESDDENMVLDTALPEKKRART
ncbi:hypothetical protein B0H34DRAFT_793880 [Crassisporium funariophilum]|nr:hypothetical protein B0H34DRAFT_793880 [Crassisporium funariophilum]